MTSSEETAPSFAQRLVWRLTSPHPLTIATYLALAIGFMMCFLQSDILYNSFVANQVALGHIDVYSFFSAHKLFRHIDTVMPPLYYLTTGLYLKLLSLVGLNPTAVSPWKIFINVFHTQIGIKLMFGLILLKLPNLAAMVVALAAVVKLTRNIPGIDRRLVIFLWIASPAVIVSVLMQAQNDAIAAAITFWAMVAFERRKLALMFLILGLAACFKTYPLVIIPPTALLLSHRKLIAVIRYGVLGAAPLAVVSLPFLAGTYMSRVFGAHDGNTLLGTSYNGRLPVHLWVLGYVVILGLAWLASKRDADIFDVALVWFLPLSLVFVFNWWVPQWAVWLMPAVVLLAARDRVFAWLWVLVNAAILIDNIFNYPGNMDGAMLEPFYGDRRHPPNSHFYNFHLFHIWQHVPYAVLDGAYIVCGALFLALAIRCVQWLTARVQMFKSEMLLTRLPSVYSAALAGPLLLVPYIGTMIVQRLAG